MSDLISRKEVMDYLTYEYNCRKGDGLKLAWIELAVNKTPPAMRWIPCSDKLPDTENMMLVSCETKKGIKTVNRAYYCNGFWHGSGSMSGVVAWMPLPEPYSGADMRGEEHERSDQ